jgi:hypothetical protein
MNPYLRAARQIPALVAHALERLNKRRENAGRPPVERGRPDDRGRPEQPGRPDQPGRPGDRGRP